MTVGRGSYFLVFILSMCCQPSYAIIVDSLYNEKLHIENKTDAEREETFKQAFNNVLTRVTGSKKVLELDDIEQSVADVEKYVSRYTYSADNDELKLKVQFDENMVNTLLEKVQQQYMHKNRPLTLLLLVMDTAAGTQILGGDSQPQIIDHIENQAKLLGLPVVFPIMDLTDQSNLAMTDIVSGNTEQLLTASQRYQAESIVVGKIQQNAGAWKVEWQMLGEKTMLHTDSQSELTASIDNFMEQLAGEFKHQYSYQQNANSKTIKLQVAGVDSLQDYARITAYLRQLAAVQQVDVVEVLPDQATFQLTTQHDQTAIAAILGRDKLLTENQQTAVNETDVPSGGEELLTFKIST